MSKPARKIGTRTKLREFFLQNIGRVVSIRELRAVAGDEISDPQRRIRDLRKLDGLQILSHNDRSDLKPGQYVLETTAQRPVFGTGISPKLRKQILERNGFTCQICGAGAGEDAPCEPGKKVRFQIDHVVPLGQGGTDDASNLRTTCVYYNKDKADVIRPASGQAISALAVIRKLPRNVQEEAYSFLKKKFGKKDGPVGGLSRARHVDP